MGLLDEIGGMLGGGQAGPGGQGGLGGLGGGQGAALLGAVISMLVQGTQGGAGGGLAGLIEKFQAAGMGAAVNSWVSSGANQPISPEQVGSVLGQDQMSQLADRFGLSTGDLGAQVSQMLPQAVDRMTPNGQVPADGGLGDIGSLLGMLTGR